MGTVLAILAGACYSAAYVAPKPWYFLGLLLSVVLVAYLRSL